MTTGELQERSIDRRPPTLRLATAATLAIDPTLPLRYPSSHDFDVCEWRAGGRSRDTTSHATLRPAARRDRFRPQAGISSDDRLEHRDRRERIPPCDAPTGWRWMVLGCGRARSGLRSRRLCSTWIAGSMGRLGRGRGGWSTSSSPREGPCLLLSSCSMLRAAAARQRRCRTFTPVGRLAASVWPSRNPVLPAVSSAQRPAVGDPG